MDSEQRLPRDEFSVRLRELTDHPGAVKASSRVDVSDFYGRSETWIIDTFRTQGGVETAFVQRMGSEPLRLMVPPAVMNALTRQHDANTTKMRRRGAQAAMATRIARGDTLGNPDALKRARKAKKR